MRENIQRARLDTFDPRAYIQVTIDASDVKSWGGGSLDNAEEWLSRHEGEFVDLLISKAYKLMAELDKVDPIMGGTR